jgi:hypothetical protein
VTRALTLLVVTAAAAATAGSAATPAPPTLSFRVFSHTNLPLSDVTWTGSRFVYTTETIGEIAESDASGSPVSHLATLPKEVEEVRCLPSPGAHGFPAGELYCHAPRGTIWRIDADGAMHVLATLPETAQQDGTIAFDRRGGFGYALLASTGGSQTNGGTVYALDASGTVRKIGAYSGPGGADNIELAPAGFGSAANELLLAIDQTGTPVSTYGALLAMKPDGTVRRLATFPDGLNPIVAIGRPDAPLGSATPGLYVADTNSKNVLFAPASQLSRFAGSVLVGAEMTAHMWIVSPAGPGFRSVRVRHNLRGGPKWNLEGAAWVG